MHVMQICRLYNIRHIKKKLIAYSQICIYQAFSNQNLVSKDEKQKLQQPKFTFQATMPGTNLIVPVVLWGKHAPTHCVSSVYLSRDQKTLVTGCYDGQICIWQVDPESLKMTPRCLLVGHTAPVTCLSRASIIQVNNS